MVDHARGDRSAQAALFASAMGGYQQSRDRMATANLKLVASIANKFLYTGMPLEDLIQEGNIGLMKAVERFDHARGYRFSTYASWWIRHAISRALADKGRAVREAMFARIPLKRFAEPEDFVGALIYLISDASSFMTGQVLYLDGGYTAC